jgi:hypothetical protein
MMIWKQSIPLQDTFSLRLPKGAKVLCVQTQYENAMIWFSFTEADPDGQTEPRTFVLATTGHPVDFGDMEHLLKYVGTFQLQGGNFVGHLFVL